MPARITRRDFGVFVGAGLVLASETAPTRSESVRASKPTAAQIVDRLKEQLAREEVAWNVPTTDTFKIGDPETEVSGIVTTFMSTLDVLQRTAAMGMNLIISHEPTFWNHEDDTRQFAEDPIYRYKKRLADENGLVVWRFHDHWHARRPDPIFQALALQLGWNSSPGDRLNFTIPAATLEEVGCQIQNLLGTHNVRIVGNSELPVTRVAMTAHLLSSCPRLLTECDAVLMCEPREFDTFEYFRDAQELGIRTGLIAISHERFEEWGMHTPCAKWVQSIVPEVRVEPLSANESYWLPPVSN